MTPAERRTATALLQTEEVVLASLRTTVTTATAGGAFSRQGLATLAESTGALVRTGVRASRRLARRVGSSDLTIEIAEAIGHTVSLRAPAVWPTDEQRAELAGAQVLGTILKVGERHIERGRVSGVLLAAGVDGQLRRIAATDTAEAFNAEREEAGAALARDPGNSFLPVILRRWCAHLDACPVCRGLHGQTRPLGLDYEDGQIPGKPHPFCRCFSSIVPIPLYAVRSAPALTL